MAVELPSSEADVQALLESAVSSRASHIRRESQTITMASVRRLLEGDLGLETSALDIHKGFIRQLVDQVLLSSDDVEAQEEEDDEQKGKSEDGDAEEDEETEEEKEEEKEVKKGKDVPKKISSSNAEKSLIKDQVLLSSDDVEAQEEEDDEQEGKSEDGDAEEDEETEEEKEEEKEEKKVKKDKDVPKKISSSNAEKSLIKKAKVENGSVEEEFEDVHMEAPKKKQQKEKKRKPKEEEDEDGGESPQDDVRVEAPKKKQRKEREMGCSKGSDDEVSNGVMSEEESDIREGKKAKKVSPNIATVKPMQNKKIEHLKKIIKACGLGIPPHLYKRAKQQSEETQDQFLVKELKEILSRRGLSSNSSDKEIKAVKQKIAREKDLEGIDTTNIILEPRGRRATSQLFAPVYNPPPPPEYDSEEGDDDEESEDGGESGSEDERKDSGGTAEDTEDSE